MVKKLIIPLLVCAFSFLSCDDDDSPSGAQRIDPGSIQGTQQVIKMTEITGSESHNLPIDEVENFLQIKATQIINLGNIDSCYYLYTSNYVLEGNRLVGKDFEGEENIDGKAYKWSTTVAFDGANMVITYTQTVSYYGESETYSLVTVFQRYNGSVPPIDWPEEICRGIYLAKKEVPGNCSFLNRF